MRPNVLVNPAGQATAAQRTPSPARPGGVGGVSSVGATGGSPPPLHSMRKSAIVRKEIPTDQEWTRKANEAKAQVEARGPARKQEIEAEEREWQALLAKATAAQAAAEEAEWRALRERAAQAAPLTEEREWAERIVKAKGATFAAGSLPARTQPKRRSAPVVVYWP